MPLRGYTGEGARFPLNCLPNLISLSPAHQLSSNQPTSSPHRHTPCPFRVGGGSDESLKPQPERSVRGHDQCGTGLGAAGLASHAAAGDSDSKGRARCGPVPTSPALPHPPRAACLPPPRPPPGPERRRRLLPESFGVMLGSRVLQLQRLTGDVPRDPSHTHTQRGTYPERPPHSRHVRGPRRCSWAQRHGYSPTDTQTTRKDPD